MRGDRSDRLSGLVCDLHQPGLPGRHKGVQGALGDNTRKGLRTTAARPLVGS